MQKITITIGGKTKEKLTTELKKKGVTIYSYAQRMLDSDDFVVSKKSEKINLLELSVKELGFDEWTETSKIYAKAESLGLELCPPEVAVELLLQDKVETSTWFVVGMKSITVDEYPFVFTVGHDAGGRWLYGYFADPDRRWSSYYRFVFRFRKQSLKHFEDALSLKPLEPLIPTEIVINEVRYKLTKV